MTQVLRNDEIEDEELGLQTQPFSHGDPQPMKSLTSSEAPGLPDAISNTVDLLQVINCVFD